MISLKPPPRVRYGKTSYMRETLTTLEKQIEIIKVRINYLTELEKLNEN